MWDFCILSKVRLASFMAPTRCVIGIHDRREAKFSSLIAQTAVQTPWSIRTCTLLRPDFICRPRSLPSSCSGGVLGGTGHLTTTAVLGRWSRWAVASIEGRGGLDSVSFLHIRALSPRHLVGTALGTLAWCCGSWIPVAVAST